MAIVDGVEYKFSHKIPAQAGSCSQFLLLRILLGYARISKGAIKARQQMNYSTYPAVSANVSWPDALRGLNASYGASLSQRDFIRRAQLDNRLFFRDLLNEFSNYFIQEERSSHVAAFVCLYRALERLSYSVPLLYCSTQKDFTKTFDQLRACFSSKETGELGLFNTFLRAGGLIDQTTLDAVCDISFASGSGLESRFYAAAEKCFDKFEIKDASRFYLGVKFANVGKLLISVRNRFFHFASGGWQNNISLTEINDADEFFGNINPLFCNFLAIVLISIIIHKYDS